MTLDRVHSSTHEQMRSSPVDPLLMCVIKLNSGQLDKLFKVQTVIPTFSVRRTSLLTTQIRRRIIGWRLGHRGIKTSVMSDTPVEVLRRAT
jgi:hypothetical protein